jgi:uncharacterized membrane protein
LFAYPLASGVLIAIARTILSASLGASVLLAVAAYFGSHEAGGGAAQGDLGFFMILLRLTPVILLSAAVGWALECFALKRSPNRRDRFQADAWLAIAILLVVAWDWLYLFVFWRA